MGDSLDVVRDSIQSPEHLGDVLLLVDVHNLASLAQRVLDVLAGSQVDQPVAQERLRDLGQRGVAIERYIVADSQVDARPGPGQLDALDVADLDAGHHHPRALGHPQDVVEHGVHPVGPSAAKHALLHRAQGKDCPRHGGDGQDADLQGCNELSHPLEPLRSYITTTPSLYGQLLDRQPRGIYSPLANQVDRNFCT